MRTRHGRETADAGVASAPVVGARAIPRIAVMALALVVIAGLLGWQGETPAHAALSALSGKTVASVATGTSHTCAVTTDGALACWGLNSNGQLGDDTTTARNIPTAVVLAGPLAGKQFAAVDAGAAHTCAVTTDGIAACWGLQTNGRLGNGLAVAANVTAPAPVTVAGTPLAGKQVDRIVAGGAFTCAVATDDTLACWGLNGNGQLGDGSTTQRLVPTAVTRTGTPLAAATVAQLTAGDAHTCARTTAGALSCWGLNTSGRLGDGSTTQRTAPTAVVTAGTPLAGTTVVDVSAGTAHTCAVTAAGTAACWGQQMMGRLGNGVQSTASITAPVAVVTAGTPFAGRTITSIEAGANHTCARASDATIACWGSNGSGPIGDGSTSFRNLPTSPTIAGTALSGVSVESIVSGGSHTCAVIVGGTVACWGANGSGQLGDSTTSGRSTAVAVIMSPALSISSITGQRTGVTSYARAGDVLVVTGSLWVPSLASGAFSVTVGGAAASHTLTSDGSGVLAGSVTVPVGAAVGTGTLQVVQSTDISVVPITVLGAREVALAPTHGRPGTAVQVTAEQFDPNAAVQVLGVTDGAGTVQSTDGVVAATISSSGQLAPMSFTVNDPATVGIVVRETAPFGVPASDRASAAFTIDPVTVSISSIAGQRAGVVTAGRAGDTLTFGGEGWPSNLTSAAFTVEWCDSLETSCSAAVGPTLSTNSSGALSGTLVIPVGATVGDRTIKVTQAGRSAVVALKILGARTLVLSPVTGRVGTVVSVSATDFDPQAEVSIRGLRASDGSVVSSDPAVTTTVDAYGAIAGFNYEVTDPLTVAIVVSETAPHGIPAVDQAVAAFTVVPATFSIVDIVGQRPGVTGFARSGDQLVIAGSAWMSSLPSGAITASLCLPNGTACGGSLPHSLTTSADGSLSGEVGLVDGISPGERALKVASAQGEALTALTVLDERSVAVSSTTIAAGDTITVTASAFDPGAAVQVRGATAIVGELITYSTDSPVTATVDAAGSLAATTFTVNDAETVFVVVTEVAPEGNPLTDWAATAVVVSAPPSDSSLRMATLGDDPLRIDLGAIASPLAPSVLYAALNTVQVTDSRSSAVGWSLTATMSDFVGSSGAAIAAGHVQISPSCVGEAGSAPGFAPGQSDQSLDSIVTLCTKDDQVGVDGTGAGTYTIDAPMALTVPAFQSAGTYSAVLTITLV